MSTRAQERGSRSQLRSKLPARFYHVQSEISETPPAQRILPCAHGVPRGPLPPTKGPSLTDLYEGSRSLVSPPLSMFNCGNATKINHKTWVTDEKHEKVPQSPPDGSKCGRVGEASSSRRPTLALYPVPGPRPAAHGGPLHSPDGATPHGICCGDTVSLQAPATRSPEPIFIYTEECQVPLRVHRTNPGCLSIFPGDREALAKVTA